MFQEKLVASWKLLVTRAEGGSETSPQVTLDRCDLNDETSGTLMTSPHEAPSLWPQGL